MQGFGAFLVKEMKEIIRTWRIWVIPGIILFVALSGPVIAKLTPALLRSIGQGQAGFVIKVPEPTVTDSYLQWVKNLTQIVLIAVVIVAAGLIVSERKAGTAVTVLTKPVSRPAFVLAKTLSEAILIGVAASAGSVVCWLLTVAVFGGAPIGPILSATGLWLLVAWMFVSLTVLLSVLVNSQAGAAGLGLLGYLLMSTLSIWGPARDYSPAGLLPATSAVLDGKSVAIAIPAISTALVITAFAILAATLFKTKEL